MTTTVYRSVPSAPAVAEARRRQHAGYDTTKTPDGKLLYRCCRCRWTHPSEKVMQRHVAAAVPLNAPAVPQALADGSPIRARLIAAGHLRPAAEPVQVPAAADPGADRQTARFKTETEALEALFPTLTHRVNADRIWAVIRRPS